MPKAYELPSPGKPFNPALFKLGPPCKRNHIHADGFTLRWLKRKTCCLCDRIDSYERQQRLRQDPEYNRRRADAIAEKRKREGRPSRSKHGLPYTPLADKEIRDMRAAIKRAGRSPSVKQLIYEQQQNHWLEHPSDRLNYVRERARCNARWRFLTDPSYRLYHRAKSKARKVAQRGGSPVHLSAQELWHRWGEFDYSCAYCGCGGDLEVEHVVPISRGGEHHLGNIVPACHQCNSSKRSSDALSWYVRQTFYESWRWQNIQSILNKSEQAARQIDLLVG